MPLKPLKMTKIPLNKAKMHTIFQTLEVFWPVSNCFSIVEVYILIILDVWGILAVYEVLRFDCLFLPFHGYFGYFRGFRVIFVVLELLRIFWSFKRFRGVYVLHILWFSGYFGDFGSIIAILVISRVFLIKKNYFTRKNYENNKKSINTPKPLRSPQNAKINKTHHRCPKYPKTPKNDQNAPKMMTTPKNFKFPKILSKPLKMTKTPLNQAEIHSNLWSLGYFGQSQVVLLNLKEFWAFCPFQQCRGVYFNHFKCFWYFVHLRVIEI